MCVVSCIDGYYELKPLLGMVTLATIWLGSTVELIMENQAGFSRLSFLYSTSSLLKVY